MTGAVRERIHRENAEDLALHLAVMRENGCIMPRFNAAAQAALAMRMHI